MSTNGTGPPGSWNGAITTPVSDRDEPPGTEWEALHEKLGELPPPQSMTLREARRLAQVALMIVLVCVGLAGGVWLLVPTEYTGRTELLYPVAVEQPTGFLREDRNLTTQLLLIGSRAVVEPVAGAHGIPVEDLQRRITVEVVDSSEIIRVDVRATDRVAAVQLAGELTERYLAISAGTRNTPARDYVSAELDRTRETLRRDPGANLRERERALVAQLDSLTTADLARPVPSVLVPPFSVPEAAGPGVGIALTTGALLGVVVAAPIVLVRARRHRR
ncbi:MULTISPECIES: hypothetical protein [unclassified Pseudonocardia]|uniref:hypothetical protein n=1 Tax=unclassified Pseudonocardia TaxID=2619320 RepID=UPI0001FFE127|nr:hypothetical protein [Pseudonocardia sp. Ae707_Ps1]OLM20182.1 hypothetical protein Ae707Ps1_4441c [Pseudonocardia sp. Ae707_Ps1]